MWRNSVWQWMIAILLMMICLLACGGIALAVSPMDSHWEIPIDAAYFPDDAFRKFVSESYDGDHDGILTSDETYNVYSISPSVSGITSLKGIEWFQDLAILNVSYSDLTEVDLSQNARLEELHINYNKLKNLDLSRNKKLWYLDCSMNSLETLDVHGLENLEYLHASLYDGEGRGNLNSVNVSGCTALRTLLVKNTAMTAVDISDALKLETLNLDGCPITALDISNHTGITELRCENSQLATLTVSGCSSLNTIYCPDSKLTELDVSGCSALETLVCNRNALRKLTLGMDSPLVRLECNENQLTELDLSGCAKLLYLECRNNQLTSLNINACPYVKTVYCGDNQLTTLVFDDCVGLQALYCNNNQLTEITPRNLMGTLNCADNQLTSLDASRVCTGLNCSNNRLTELIMPTSLQMKTIRCNDNQLTELKFDKLLYSLEHLFCQHNQIKTLDLTNCPVVAVVIDPSGGYHWETSEDGKVITISDRTQGTNSSDGPPECAVFDASITITENGNVLYPTSQTNPGPGQIQVEPYDIRFYRGELMLNREFFLTVANLYPVQIDAVLFPSNAVTTITWTSDNPSIATVDNGLITAISKGQTTVTATTSNGKSVSLTVNAIIMEDETETPTPTPTPDPTQTPPPTPTASGEPEATREPETTGPVQKLIPYQDGVYEIDSSRKTATFVKPTKSVKNFTIPDTVPLNGKEIPVTRISDRAFYGDKKLTKVTIGKNVKEIGISAFDSCGKLKTVSGGVAVTTIGNYAFTQCKKLTSVPELKKLKTIGDGAFGNCAALGKITISSKVTKIGARAFYGCGKLKTITIKTKKLKEKSVGANAFDGTPKNATYQCPSGKKASYQKILVKKGASKKATFK